ncbi:MAG: methyl-accepting chemotaxis protein [Lachnospiraceae bacterium]|nr:methyl-accepting chemotaxis protein [Lachnospiraceae bacterium]
MGNNTVRKKHLIGHIVTIAVVGIVALALVLCIIAYTQLRTSYHSMGEEELKVACLELQHTLDNLYEGDWHMEDGRLWKGDWDLENDTENIEGMLKEVKDNTGLDYTIIMDKTRAVTTIEGMKGKDIGDAAYNAVKSGKPFADFKTKINGKNYYVYYTPENQNGKYVGCFFAGRVSEDIDSRMNSAIMVLIVIAVLITIGFVVLGLILSQKYSRMMKEIADNVDTLASGDLSVKVDQDLVRRKDELGIIGEGVENLTGKLNEVISRSQAASRELDTQSSDLADSAAQASQASDQVTDAVTEISKGAVAQAESVESAVSDTDDIGKNIENITSDVTEMDRYAEEMKDACDKAMDALEKLIRQSEEVTVSVKEIGDTINSTNDSAKTISEFTQAITDIATQTNLLSLNASIEAARAGDAGRGFAVVADEIRQLADQSSESADKIKSIVERLLADSASSVSVLEKLNESFGVQATQLDSTRSNMVTMNENVASVKNTSAHITQRIASLNDAKNGLMEIISDLSAISEENAASTEETNASMEELNATFTIISEAAGKLQNLSTELADSISYFKL